MKKVLPCKLRKAEYTIGSEWLEAFLQSPDTAPKLPEMWTQTKNKEGKMFDVVIRPIKPEEIDPLLEFLKLTLDKEYDMYDMVGVRVLAELLAIKRRRMKDEYFFVALCEGRLVGIANGRLMNEKVNISLHSLTFERQVSAGAILFYAKAWYTFEICEQQEFWVTFESINGWMMGGMRMALPSYPWPDMQHELGGAKIFYLSKKQWDDEIKAEYLKQISRAEFKPASKELIAKNAKMIIPDKLDV